MKTIAKKTHFFLFLYSELIAGILCFVLVAAVTGLLAWYGANGQFSTIENVPVAITILAIFYLLCVVGGGWLIARFVKWKRLPEDLISIDDEYMYIFTNREIKIAIKDVKSVFAGPESFWVHILGGGYGTVEVETYERKYKVCFVDEANTVPDVVMNIINKTQA